MNVSALLTSAAINVGVCVLLLSLYSVLRKQPSNLSVWILRAWETPEDEILAVGGLDAVVFLRIIIFSLRGVLGLLHSYVCFCTSSELLWTRDASQTDTSRVTGGFHN
ncbi:hypothetical protein MLD38_002022 [Melastoma candidum]|uniref:Uncharacterized protein n=1 Tax=Melastoma candidum TaxID=119954 RepID=A0ACB9SFJ3_9MYRT|nr:hypothetical protein MLD38_002022 [Melastoma candidum]